MDRLFGDPGEAGVLGKVGDVPVHLAVHLYVLYDFVPVGLQAAVHVVQLYPGDAPGRGVVELGRQVFRDLVVLPVLFPAGDDVPSLVDHHVIHPWNLFRGILQVGVHGDDDPAFGFCKAMEEGCGLAVVAPEGYSLDAVVILCKTLDPCP